MTTNRRKGKERDNEGIVAVTQREVDEMIMQESGNWRHKTRVENGQGNLAIPPSSAVTAKNTIVSTMTEKTSLIHTNCVLGTGGGRPFLAIFTCLIQKENSSTILENGTVLFNNFLKRCSFEVVLIFLITCIQKYRLQRYIFDSLKN